MATLYERSNIGNQNSTSMDQITCPRVVNWDYDLTLGQLSDHPPEHANILAGASLLSSYSPKNLNIWLFGRVSTPKFNYRS